MDLHPEVEERLGLLPGGRGVAAPLRAASRAGYCGASFVVSLGSFMARRIREKGVSAGRIREIPPWNRGDAIHPVPPSENPLRAELGYGTDDFVVLYSGNAGLAHMFEEVLDAAARLQEHENIEFLFVGGGPKRTEIEREARRLRLPRFQYVDYVPREELAHSLSVGDVHLLTLRPDMAGLVVPSKLYASMAAGRPILMVGPEASDPGKVIQRARVGVVIEPGEGGGERLADAILAYRNDPTRRSEEGRRAREVFLATYDRSVCCEAWAELLREVLERGRLS